MPSSFKQPLIVKKLNGRKWEVMREFEYYVDWEGKKDLIKVPKGFITDFASVPRLFWIILPPDGKYTQAAVLHDYLYSTPRLRKESDRIFKNAMKVLGVPMWKYGIMFSAVRMFGWIPFKKRRI